LKRNIIAQIRDCTLIILYYAK